MTGRPDPDALATFCQRLLDMVRANGEDDWVVVGDSPGRPSLAFQKAEGRQLPGADLVRLLVVSRTL